jgi:hypothetical protein
MSDKLVEMLEEQASRRGFFGKVGVGLMMALAALLGIGKPAHALRSVFCCTLCTSDCSGSCPGCWWIWTCCINVREYLCKECYKAGAACNGSCTNIHCSLAVYAGNFC